MVSAFRRTYQKVRLKPDTTYCRTYRDSAADERRRQQRGTLRREGWRNRCRDRRQRSSVEEEPDGGEILFMISTNAAMTWVVDHNYRAVR